MAIGLGVWWGGEEGDGIAWYARGTMVDAAALGRAAEPNWGAVAGAEGSGKVRGNCDDDWRAGSDETGGMDRGISALGAASGQAPG